MATLQVPPNEARNVLSPHVASGRGLVSAAAMVGDEDDFGVWSWRCKDWSTGLLGALRYIYGDEVAKTFAHAVRVPWTGAAWQSVVPDQVQRLEGTLEMLCELSDALADQGDRDRVPELEPATE